MRNRSNWIGAAVLALALMATPAFAQQSGLVNVDISNNDVANDIARNLNVNVQDVIKIGSVQVPIGVAANVCDVNANVLAQQAKEGTAQCTARNSSTALARVVQRTMAEQQQ